MSLKKPFSCDSCASDHPVASQFTELKNHRGLQAHCDLALCYSSCDFHFLKLAPNPFRPCLGLVRTLSVTSDKLNSYWLKPKREYWLVQGQSALRRGRLLAPWVAFSLQLYYFHSQAPPKGCEAIPKLASLLASLVEGVLSLPPNCKSLGVNSHTQSSGVK